MSRFVSPASTPPSTLAPPAQHSPFCPWSGQSLRLPVFEVGGTKPTSAGDDVTAPLRSQARRGARAEPWLGQ